MRKIFPGFLTLLIGVLFFTSCDKQKKYTSEIKQLDSLQQTVSKLAVEFKKIDTVMVIAKRDSIISHLTFIYNNYKDTMPKETAISLQEYRSIKKPLDTFIKKSRGTLEEVEYTEKQVNRLIHDLENDLMDEEKSKQYFTDERIAMEKLIRKMTDMSALVNENSRKYEELYPKVQDEINKLKGKNGLGTGNE